jgi:hypothetical protein
MKRLWGLALIAVIPWLIPWPAAAGSATEYGMMTSQKAAGAPAIQRVGTATGNNLGAAAHKPSGHKKKAKG